MRKRQLADMYNNLLAELECKAQQCEALRLRLEESNARLSAAVQTEQNTKQLLAATQKALQVMEQQAAIMAEKPQSAPASEMTLPDDFDELPQMSKDEPSSEVLPLADAELPVAAPADDDGLPAAETAAKAPQSIAMEPADDAASPTQSTAAHPCAPAFTVDLRTYGAELIGQVSKSAAQLIADVEQAPQDDPILKSIALGKLEEFKGQILQLLQSNQQPAEQQAAMCTTAEDCIAYLQGLKNRRQEA